MEIRDVANPPSPTGTQVLVSVRASALNRADLLQRKGLYPAPAGYSQEIPGLEFAGEVAATGESVTKFQTGQRVFGITGGGAQAEFLLTNENQLAEIPDNLSFTEAAAIPEAFITAYDAIFAQAGLHAGESLLIHAVGSGVGLAALQLAKAKGIKTFGTSRTEWKLERCLEFGLDEAILTDENTNFADVINKKTAGKGVNVILDLVGGAYFPENLKALASKGRLMLVGLTAGRTAEFDMGVALSKRLTIVGTVLRSRSSEEKAAATSVFEQHVVPLLKTGILKTNVDRVFRLDEIAEAHQYLESGKSFGKVVLEV